MTGIPPIARPELFRLHRLVLFLAEFHLPLLLFLIFKFLS